MSSQQRIAVWRGDRLKTTGGLFKKDLIKNKRGKIVSAKKSGQARKQNNLGDFLRDYKEKVSKGEMLRPAGAASKARALAKTGKAAPAKKQKPPPKPKAGKRPKLPKPKPEQAAPPPKPKPKPVAAKKQAAPMPVPRKKKALPKGYNPVTRQPYEKKSGLGYVASGSVNLDNVTTMGKEQRERRSGRGGAPKKMTREMVLEAKRKRWALWRAKHGKG